MGKKILLRVEEKDWIGSIMRFNMPGRFSARNYSLLKLLGIDYGTKTCGLALSDQGQSIAFPFENVPLKLVLERICRIIQEESVSEIVLGYPVNMKGEETFMTQQVKEFYERISQHVSIPVHLQDERLVSKSVDKLFQSHGINSKKSRHIKDAIEAAYILQCFLDKRMFRETGSRLKE